jgi:hypothetical protein
VTWLVVFATSIVPAVLTADASQNRRTIYDEAKLNSVENVMTTPPDDMTPIPSCVAIAARVSSAHAAVAVVFVVFAFVHAIFFSLYSEYQKGIRAYFQLEKFHQMFIEAG